VATCIERIDSGRMCRRKAITRDGRCGKCHAITDKGGQCQLSAKGSGKYCGTYHNESSIESLKKGTSRGRPRKPNSDSKRTRKAASSRPASVTNRNVSPGRRKSSGSGSPDPAVGDMNVPPHPSQEEKDEAARLCADAIADHELSHKTLRIKLLAWSVRLSSIG
jgi:hypothetical protein